MLQIYFTKPTRTLQRHPFFNFYLKILKDCDNLISLGTRSHIFGPRNEMDCVPCLTEFTLRLRNVSFRRKLYGREASTNISFRMGEKKPCQTVNFYFKLSYVLKRGPTRSSEEEEEPP